MLAVEDMAAKSKEEVLSTYLHIYEVVQKSVRLILDMRVAMMALTTMPKTRAPGRAELATSRQRTYGDSLEVQPALMR
jgi:hypothetical protein